MLLLLNGPPGVGKSTMAARYVDDHPPALNLDLDVLRGQIGGWQADPARAGVLTRAIALAAARPHLSAGHDVVVPQFLGRVEFILELSALAAEVGTEFVEVVLLDSKENVRRRFFDRNDPVKHTDSSELSTMYDRLLELLAARPDARIVHANGIPETYAALRRALALP
jgi:predicted kinase